MNEYSCSDGQENDAASQAADSKSGKVIYANNKMIISYSLADFGTPGVWVEIDPDIAESMGAFEETAISVADAEEDGDDN
jgi:hypothetical protein